MIRLLFFLSLIIGAFGWGIAAGTYKIFPYAQVQALQDVVAKNTPLHANDPGYRSNEAAALRGIEMADWDTQADIVMIGDSITELAPWKDMFPGADILNRGASGDTVEGVVQRLDAILKAEPQTAFVLIGTNDLNLINPIDETLKRYDRVILRLKKAGVTTHIQSVPTCEKRHDFCTHERREAEGALNAGIAELASKHDVGFIDLAREFPRGIEYRKDGVHPTVAGYKAWRNVLKPAVISETAEGETE